MYDNKIKASKIEPQDIYITQKIRPVKAKFIIFASKENPRGDFNKQ